MDVRFKPKFSRQGSSLAILYGKQVDAGITASATTAIQIAAPWRSYSVLRASFHMTTVPAGSGIISLMLIRNSPQVAPNAIFYNVPIDLRGLNANQVYPIPFAPNVNTAVLPENIFQYVTGDLGPTLGIVGGVGRIGCMLYTQVSAAGTVTTQPVGLTIVAEVAVAE